MAGSMKSLCTVLIAAALIAAVAPPCEAAILCSTVVSSITPCLPYVTGNGSLAPACCNGIRNLNSVATTTPERQTVCKCLKSLAGSISGINLSKAAGLPGQCGVSVPYEISPSTDCSKVT